MRSRSRSSPSIQGGFPGETYTLIDRVREHYPIAIEVYYPEAQALEALRAGERDQWLTTAASSCARTAAPFAETAPLARAAAGRGARGSPDSAGRSRSPARRWRSKSSIAFMACRSSTRWPIGATRRSGVTCAAMASPPTLHARGYPSIGCAPCTRAIEPGEDVSRRALVVGAPGSKGVRPAPPTARRSPCAKPRSRMSAASAVAARCMTGGGVCRS